MADNDTLGRIESKIDRLADQISDLSNRVTRLETSESTKASETDRRFLAIETSVSKIITTQENQAKTLDEASGATKILKWLLPLALGLGGAGTAAGFTAAMADAPTADVTP